MVDKRTNFEVLVDSIARCGRHGQARLVKNGHQQDLSVGTTLTFCPWKDEYVVTRKYGYEEYYFFQSEEGILIAVDQFFRDDSFTNFQYGDYSQSERVQYFIRTLWKDHSLKLTITDVFHGERNNIIWTINYHFRIEQCILGVFTCTDADEIEHCPRLRDFISSQLATIKKCKSSIDNLPAPLFWEIINIPITYLDDNAIRRQAIIPLFNLCLQVRKINDDSEAHDSTIYNWLRNSDCPIDFNLLVTFLEYFCGIKKAELDDTEIRRLMKRAIYSVTAPHKTADYAIVSEKKGHNEFFHRNLTLELKSRCPLVSPDELFARKEYAASDMRYYTNYTHASLFLTTADNSLDQARNFIQKIIDVTNCKDSLPSKELLSLDTMCATYSPAAIHLLAPIDEPKYCLCPMSPTGTIPNVVGLRLLKSMAGPEEDCLSDDKKAQLSLTLAAQERFKIKLREEKEAREKLRVKQELIRIAEERRRLQEQREREERERLSDFNFINRNNRDSLLEIDEKDHAYSVKGISLLGVTKFISSFFPPFDEDRIAEEVARKRSVSVKTIKEEWAHDTEAGIQLHKDIDLFFHGKQVESGGQDFQLFMKFVSDNQIHPFRTEWNVYDEDSEIIGTIDLLDCTNGRYTMYDWKRSKHIIGGNGLIKHNPYEQRYAYYPIADIEDLPFWHYSLQQNIYRYILRNKYGIDVKRMKLVVFHPTLTSPEVVDIPNMSTEVEKLIQTRL